MVERRQGALVKRSFRGSHGCRAPSDAGAVQAVRLQVTGLVQGVGFRPWVWRIATRAGLCGAVWNEGGGVEIEVEGRADSIEHLVDQILHSPPVGAKPTVASRVEVARCGRGDFTIAESVEAGAQPVAIAADRFACPECMAELLDSRSRRFGYPLLACTRCGPRYTIIDGLPYDRERTTLRALPMCEACREEYGSPVDRRCHAQAIACPSCGPRLWCVSSQRHPQAKPDVGRPLEVVVDALRRGCIVAIMGVGGYQLICDATRAAVVATLRSRKARPTQPFALMVAEAGEDGLDEVRARGRPSAASARLLMSPERPIVLVPRRAGTDIVEEVAPGVSDWGLMLPSSLVHWQILRAFGRPLVATSGNRHGQPLEFDPVRAEERLGGIADCFLHHDRAIANPVDDGVYRQIAGRPRRQRIGRGVTPMELDLGFDVGPPTIALGGHVKSTVTLAWGRRAVVSPHIGALDSPASLDAFDRMIVGLQRLYGQTAERWIVDAHPAYGSRRWLRDVGVRAVEVFHHHAHASSLAHECGVDGQLLVFTWDGAGLGPDGTLWGGEALLGRPGRWHRVGWMRPFRVAGGDRVAREPWRSAAAVCEEAGQPWPLLQALDPAAMLRSAERSNINCHVTTAVGRLFDASAALVMDLHQATYEGEAGARLEAQAGGVADRPSRRSDAVIWTSSGRVIDWRPWVPALLDDRVSVADRARDFHAGLADALVELARQVSAETPVALVGLTGGVFQNRVLAEGVLARLAAAGMRAFLPTELPVNDAGLSFGQLIEVCGT